MSCEALPAWPSAAQLEDAGILDITEHTATLVVSTTIGIAGAVPFILQAFKIWRYRSVLGTSVFSIVVSMMVTCIQAGAASCAQSPAASVCPHLSPTICFQNILPALQILVQAFFTLLQMIVYMIFWHLETSRLKPDICNQLHGESTSDAASGGSRRETPFVSILATMSPLASTGVDNLPFAPRSRPVRRWRSALLAWLGFAVSVIALFGIPWVPVVAGPCTPLVRSVKTATGFVASVGQALVYVPQILLLRRTRQAGSLSCLAILIQAFGGLAFVVDFLCLRGSFWEILPYVVLTAECGLILGMLCYYGRRQSDVSQQV